MTKTRLNTERTDELFTSVDDRGFEAFAPKKEEATMAKVNTTKQVKQPTRTRDFYIRRAQLVAELNAAIDTKGGTFNKAAWVKALTKELGVHAHPSLLALYVPFSPGFSHFVAKWTLVSSNQHKILLTSPVEEGVELRLVINKEELRATLWLGNSEDKASWKKVDTFKGGGSA